jgi:hypothetical protein
MKDDEACLGLRGPTPPTAGRWGVRLGKPGEHCLQHLGSLGGCRTVDRPSPDGTDAACLCYDGSRCRLLPLLKAQFR